MAKSTEKRIKFKARPKNRKSQIKFAKRIAENHKILSNFEK